MGSKAKGKRGRAALNNVPVLILVERDGEARLQALKTVAGKTARHVHYGNVGTTAHLTTDALAVY